MKRKTILKEIGFISLIFVVLVVLTIIYFATSGMLGVIIGNVIYIPTLYLLVSIIIWGFIKLIKRLLRSKF